MDKQTKKVKDKRVNIRFNDNDWEAMNKMASDVNIPFLHFCSVALSMGARQLHRQIVSIERIPDSAWQGMAMGFAAGMNEEAFAKSISDMFASNPQVLDKMIAASIEQDAAVGMSDANSVD